MAKPHNQRDQQNAHIAPGRPLNQRAVEAINDLLDRQRPYSRYQDRIHLMSAIDMAVNFVFSRSEFKDVAQKDRDDIQMQVLETWKDVFEG